MLVLGHAGVRIETVHVLFFATIGILVGAAAWKVKRFMWADVQTGSGIKLAVFLIVSLVSGYAVWLFRNRVGHWFDAVQSRITPLVWIFVVLAIIAVPITGFSVLMKDSHIPIPQSLTSSSVNISANERPNILLVSFDALTARDMSLYGYGKQTTPFLSQWAKNATVFTKAEASSNHTSPASASMMTGKRVWTHQLFQQGGFPVKSDIESLPGELKNKGYYNVAFIVNPWASTAKLGMLDSFDISPLSVDFNREERMLTFDGDLPGMIDNLLYRVFGDKIKKYSWVTENRLLGVLQPIIAPISILMNPEISRTAFPPEKAFNRLLDIYDSLPEPFFVWVHVYPPHAYCLPPEPYRGMFGPSFPPERFNGDILNDEPHNLRDNRILYDEFIRYCDSQLEEFLKQLEEKDKHQNTTVILTSDHGESFQHGVYGHGGVDLYEQHTHIPLIIKERKQTDGEEVHRLVEQIDIPATILDLAGIPVPDWMEGRSLVPLLRGAVFPHQPAFSMFLRLNRSRGHRITKGTIAVWEGKYKLIHYLEDGRSLLFNLLQDPEELDNLIDEEPEIGRNLLELIKKNLAEANRGIKK
jgi:arylsulfatase A-like enzyme